VPLRHSHLIRHVFAAASLAACVAVPARAQSSDPLKSLLIRADNFLRREESGGATLDPRRLFNLPEEIRLSVVPQLLGYCELQPLAWREDSTLSLVERADFLIQGMDAFRAYDAGDGMLGYALLRAFEITGNPRYQEAARPIVETCLALDLSQLRLNRGLMAALVLAQHHRMTGDESALAKAREIVWLTAREQHADGSFAHVCPPSRDVHYTAWMAMELHLLGRILDDPVIPSALGRAHAFLQDRVGLDGITSYEKPIALDRMLYYYSLPTCPGDYDTRGWTNELGYLALLFDRFKDERYRPVIGHLATLEDKGAFPDKLGYWPPPEDPFYGWASASRSVIRTSLIFWSLACAYADRLNGMPKSDLLAEERIGSVSDGPEANPRVRSLPTATSAGSLHLGLIAPNPARGGAWIELRLPDASAIHLSIHDPAGRRVRSLLDSRGDRGLRRVRWDGRDDAGLPAPPGMYFVRLDVQGQSAATARFVLVR
jgi:hypothetical protein